MERHPVKRKIKKDRTVGQKQVDGCIRSDAVVKVLQSRPFSVKTLQNFMAVPLYNYIAQFYFPH